MNSVVVRWTLLVLLVLVGVFALTVAGFQLYFAFHGVRDIFGDRTSASLGLAVLVFALGVLFAARALYRTGK